MVNLETTFCGLKLRNPTILASGVLGVNPATMARVYAKGAGMITLKSISHETRKGFPNPTMLGTKHYFMNAVGLSGVGVDNSEKVVKQLKAAGIPIIASIFSCSFAKAAEVGAKFEAFGADMLEINVSCPNIVPGEGIGTAIGVEAELTAQITADVRKQTTIPLLVKLTPNVTDIVSIAKAAVAAGADGLVAGNTFGPGLKIDIETGQPVLFNKFGGVSGPGIFPLALAIVYKLYEAVKVPIIGMGGITTYQDALEMVMAGATGIGIGTAVYYEGMDVFQKVVAGMTEWMEAHGYHSLDEIRGMAHGAKQEEPVVGKC